MKRLGLAIGLLVAVIGVAIPGPVVAAERVSSPSWDIGPWQDSGGLETLSGRLPGDRVAAVNVSAGWYIYVRFSREDVQNINYQLASYGNHAAAAVMCVLLPFDYLKAACEYLGNEYVNSVVNEIAKAKSEGKCFEERWTYPPRMVALVGWRAYAC